MTRVALALALLALSACAAPSKEQAIQTALDAGKIARDAERAACLLALSDRSITREPGFDNYCEAILKGCPLP